MGKAGFEEINEIVYGAFKSVFYHKRLGLLFTHVDDVPVLSKFPQEIKSIITKSFDVKWFDKVDSFSGAELEYSEEGYSVNMTKSIEKKVNALPKSFKNCDQIFQLI